MARLEEPDDSILAFVEVPALEDPAGFHHAAEDPGLYATGHGCAVHYVRQPFDREPDWAATSVRYDWGKLIERATEVTDGSAARRDISRRRVHDGCRRTPRTAPTYTTGRFRQTEDSP